MLPYKWILYFYRARIVFLFPFILFFAFASSFSRGSIVGFQNPDFFCKHTRRCTNIYMKKTEETGQHTRRMTVPRKWVCVNISLLNLGRSKTKPSLHRCSLKQILLPLNEWAERKVINWKSSISSGREKMILLELFLNI